MSDSRDILLGVLVSAGLIFLAYLLFTRQQTQAVTMYQQSPIPIQEVQTPQERFSFISSLSHFSMNSEKNLFHCH